MSIRIEKYSESLKSKWEQFVLEAKNSTFLHSRSFYAHNPLNAKDDCSLLFYKDDSVIAAFPANLYEKNGSRILHSYLRATYGGILINNKIGIEDVLSTVKLLIDFAKNNNVSEIIIRAPFKIYNATLSDEIDYALWKFGFQIKNRELELALDLSENIDAQYSDSTKRCIRKAQKHEVIVNENGALDKFWIILEENLRGKYGTAPVHSFNEIKYLISSVGEDKIRLFTAEYKGEVIGGILIFIANSQVVHAQYIASDYQFQEYRPLNAIVDYIAKWAQANKFRYFNLGMATEPGGFEINPGLFRFKEGFGARGVLRETMHLYVNSNS